MDLSHVNHFYPRDASSPEITSDTMDSESMPGHIMDQPNEQTAEAATSTVSNQRWLPLRPLTRDDEMQTPQAEADQSDVTYSELPTERSAPPSQEAGVRQLSNSNSSSPPPDTLVFIDYPNNARFSQYTGLNLPIRVHSTNLLGTGSRVFRDLLAPTKNFRTIRRRKLANKLPPGIQYVIDLTPPDEGDEAVDLTADLSLSLGIQKWCIMSRKAGIPDNICRGSDESADSDLIPLLAVESSSQPHRLRETSPKKLDTPEGADPSKSTGIAAPRTYAEAEADLKEAVLLSKTSQEGGVLLGRSPKYEVPEYSHIRHRLGIQRLLQVIEGRDPVLDSAAKVWTLSILAKHFDCTISVVDHVSKWLLGEPNSLFVEILPEMTARMGLGLQTHAVTRAAFSILVGEEALALICRRRPSSDLEHPETTRFARRKEDIDEDLKNRIEYASKAFEERISKAFEDLFSSDLEWLNRLPEYKKIASFQAAIMESEEENGPEWASCIEILRHMIVSFIRRRILCALNSSIVDGSSILGIKFTDHRNLETMGIMPEWTVGEPLYMYDKLSMPERVFTRPFWKKLHAMGFTIEATFSTGSPLTLGAEVLVKQDNIELVTYSGLISATRNFGDAVIEAISAGCLNGGRIPPGASLSDNVNQEDSSQTTSADAPDFLGNGNLGPAWNDSSSTIPLVGSWDPNPEQRQLERELLSPPVPSFSLPFGVNSDTRSDSNLAYVPSPLSKYTTSNPPIEKLGMTIPPTELINEDSPFLDIALLLLQVNNYITEICSTMLSTRNMAFEINTTDVLVCLTDNEFKYLPVIAGGQDDGTGLVFTDPVPEAANGLAPIGPGPSYRTGFSTVSADNGSEFSYGGDSENSGDTDQGSRFVEDGYSGIFPRTRMAVGSDVASVAWSDGGDTNTEFEFGKGKGKGVIHGKATEMVPISTPRTSVAGDYGNDSVVGATNADITNAMRDVDMGRELHSVAHGTSMYGDHDMGEPYTDTTGNATGTTASSTTMDDDDDDFDYSEELGYEEEGSDQEDDDNDTAVGDAGYICDAGDVANEMDRDDVSANVQSTDAGDVADEMDRDDANVNLQPTDGMGGKGKEVADEKMEEHDEEDGLRFEDSDLIDL